MPITKPAAVITGGAKGIGRAIARHLLSSGWQVGIIDLPDSGLRRAFSRQRGVLVIEGDVRNEETASDAVDAMVHRFRRLDAVVSNAGIMIRKPLRRLTLAEWHRVLDTNLTAAFLLARAAEKPLRRAHGAIVTIASTRALMSEPNTESYSASKGGLVALTHALAISLAPDVRVNCVSPGCCVLLARRKDLACPTRANRPVEGKGQFPELSNLARPALAIVPRLCIVKEVGNGAVK